METFLNLLMTAAHGGRRAGPLEFKDFLATVEGLLLPDRPSVPGKSRLNTSVFPRSRYKAHPTLLPPAPRLPKLRKPRL